MVGSLIQLGIDRGIVVDTATDSDGELLHKIKWLPDGRPDWIATEWLNLRNANHFKVLVKAEA
jgi:hypothetical protein